MTEPAIIHAHRGTLPLCVLVRSLFICSWSQNQQVSCANFHRDLSRHCSLLLRKQRPYLNWRLSSAVESDPRPVPSFDRMTPIAPPRMRPAMTQSEAPDGNVCNPTARVKHLRPQSEIFQCAASSLVLGFTWLAAGYVPRDNLLLVHGDFILVGFANRENESLPLCLCLFALCTHPGFHNNTEESDTKSSNDG